MSRIVMLAQLPSGRMIPVGAQDGFDFVRSSMHALLIDCYAKLGAGTCPRTRRGMIIVSERMADDAADIGLLGLAEQWLGLASSIRSGERGEVDWP